MTRSISRTRLPPAQRRAQLIRCAFAAFAEHGIARATHAHVAERAGVSVPAVHSYFRTREDLVAETLVEVEKHLLAILADPRIAEVSAREALTIMVRGFDKAAQDDPDVVKIWLDWSTGFRADVWPRYLQMQERLYAIVRGALERGRRSGELSAGLDPGAGAQLFVGGGHTVALFRFAGGEESAIDRLIDHLIQSITSIGFDHPLAAGRGH
ncbi:TetR/AcrR family transcriptional regulator [Zavarzinia aquatilis]|nr:TetR/AcrR family transcriptional regulator [Zavarzinia aquatilis]